MKSPPRGPKIMSAVKKTNIFKGALVNFYYKRFSQFPKLSPNNFHRLKTGVKY